MTEQPESREATNPTGFYILPSYGFDYVELFMNNLSDKSNVLVARPCLANAIYPLVKENN